MGPYLTCLLDVGELPNLGGGEVSGECTVENFELGANRAGVAGSGSRGSSSGGQSGSKNESKDSLGDTESAKSKDKDNSRGGFAGRSNRPSEVASRGGDGPRTGEKVVQEVPEELAQSRYFKLARSTAAAGSGGRRRFIASQGIAGVIALEKEKLERRQGRIRTLAAANAEKSKSKKLVIKPQERKVAEASSEEGWSFGQFFRIVLIVMMIVAIVLFIGGQVFQISKGMDK
jgi:hypothetical protein